MAPTVIVQKGSDEPIHIPVVGVDSTWSASASVKQWPSGPDVHKWSTARGSAVIEAGEVVLLTSDSEKWKWTSGEFRLTLSGPQGRLVRGPFRVRVRS